MALIKITQQLMQGKGVTGLPDVPGLTSQEMQAKFDELSRDVVAPAFNANIDTLLSEDATQEIGASVPSEVTADPLPLEGQPAKLAAVLQGIVNYVKSFVQGFTYSKEETNEQISTRIVEIGTGDMAKAVYDHNSDGVVNSAEYAITAGNSLNASNAQSAENGCFEYAHTKADTINALTGTGANIKFTATASYILGDTFTVNNVAVTAKNLIGFASGDIVACFVNGNVLDFGQQRYPQNYSTVERWTGDYWVNGYKLYSKAIIIPPNIPNGSSYASGLTANDEVVFFKGSCGRTNNGGEYYPLSHPYNAGATYPNVQLGVFLLGPKKGIVITLGQNLNPLTRPLTMVLYYYHLDGGSV